MPNQTDKTLAQIRTELLTTFSAGEWELYNHLVGWLRDTDVASHALKVGDAAPDFLLRDADGRLHSSKQLRRGGPLVLSFSEVAGAPFAPLSSARFRLQKTSSRASARPSQP
jgi:hypothetical protein